MKKTALCLLALFLLGTAAAARCQDFSAPIYTEMIPTASGLPYNPVTDFRESFKAPNGKTVEVLVKGPQGSGSYTRAIKAGETPDVYFPAVVAEAMKVKAHHLIIPKGTYNFKGPALCTDSASAACNLPSACNALQYYNCSPHWMIGQYPQGQQKVPDSVSDLDIDLSDSVLNFSAPVIGIWILEAQRLRLRNFTVDWPALPIASLGHIVKDPDSPGHKALVIDPQYSIRDKYQGGTAQVQAVDPWDDSEVDPPGVFDPKSNNIFETYFIFGDAPQPTYLGKTAAGEQTFSCKSCHFENSATDPSCSFFAGCANFDQFAVGARVIVRHYTYNGFAFLVNWSNDIDFENVKLRTGPGIGFSIANEGGYRGFRLANSEIKRGLGRVIATASDGIDMAAKADLVVENNEIGYQGDDSVSIYQNTAAVAGVEGKTIDVAGVCDPDATDEPVVGDMLAFFGPNFGYKASAKVVAASGVFCAPILKLTLDHAIDGLDTTDNYLDLTQQASARYIISGNFMHDCRCHGVLVNAPYGSIADNVMYHNSAGAIQLAGGDGSGPGANNLTIHDNLFSNPGQSAQTYGAMLWYAGDAGGVPLGVPVFEKIKVERNVFEQMPGPAVVVTSARDFAFENNTIIDANQAQTDPAQIGPLSTLDSMLIDKSAEGLVCGTERLGSLTGRIGLDPSDSAVSIQSSCP